MLTPVGDVHLKPVSRSVVATRFKHVIFFNLRRANEKGFLTQSSLTIYRISLACEIVSNLIGGNGKRNNKFIITLAFIDNFFNCLMN